MRPRSARAELQRRLPLPFPSYMSLRAFEARRADGLAAARWIAPCGGVRSALWAQTSASLETLRRAAARVETIRELVALIGSEPVVYAVAPCDRAGCCARELPRASCASDDSGIRVVDPRRASSVPPAPAHVGS